MHKAKACVLMCMDFRFHEDMQKWLKEQGYLGHSDEVVVAGASRDLVKPLEDFHKNALLRQIELSVKLHNPDEIVIIDHQDCGGYAQDGTIPSGLSLEDDKHEHGKYLEQLREMLNEKFPEKAVRTFYAQLDKAIVEIK